MTIAQANADEEVARKNGTVAKSTLRSCGKGSPDLRIVHDAREFRS